MMARGVVRAHQETIKTGPEQTTSQERLVARRATRTSTKRPALGAEAWTPVPFASLEVEGNRRYTGFGK